MTDNQDDIKEVPTSDEVAYLVIRQRVIMAASGGNFSDVTQSLKIEMKETFININSRLDGEKERSVAAQLDASTQRRAKSRSSKASAKPGSLKKLLHLPTTQGPLCLSSALLPCKAT